MALVVLGYFGLFDLGLGRAATRFVAAALGSGSDDRVPSIAWTAVTAQACVGLLGTATLIAIVPWLVDSVLNIPLHLRQEARSSFYVLALSIPCVLVSGSFRGVLEAAQRFDLVNAAAAPLSTANFLLPYVGVLLRWSLPAIVAVLFASRAIGAIVFYALCIRQFPSLKGIPRFRMSEAKVLLTFGGWITVSSVVSPALVYLDRLMLGILMTMAAVTYYAAPYEMVTRLLLVPFSLTAALFPAFSGLHQQRDAAVLERLVGSSIKFLLLLLTPIVVILLAFSREVLNAWLGPDFARQSSHALQILSLGVFANSVAQVPLALIQGSGRPDVTARIHLIELPLQALIAWGLVRLWGITGAAVAWSARTTLDLVLLSFAAVRVTSVSWRSPFQNDLRPVLAWLATLSVAATGSQVLVQSLLLRLVSMGLLLATAGMVAWFYILSDVDRARITQLLPQGLTR